MDSPQSFSLEWALNETIRGSILVYTDEVNTCYGKFCLNDKYAPTNL